MPLSAFYFKPLARGLTIPLGRPLPRPSGLPLDEVPRTEGSRDWRVSGVVDLVFCFADTGGFSTKDVSVVLYNGQSRATPDTQSLENRARGTCMKVVSPSFSCREEPAVECASCGRSLRNDSELGPTESQVLDLT